MQNKVIDKNTYNIKINEFEGPLDLLLHLIKKDNINIYEISITKITQDYLDYIHKMEELNIEVASSYLVMAAELMEIKSASLLPQKPKEEGEDEEEVSKEALINKLVEYQKYKELAPFFKEKEQKRKEIYIKSPEKIKNYIEESKLLGTGNIDDLVKAMNAFLKRKDDEKPLTTKVTTKEYSIKERKQSILKTLKEKGRVTFTSLFEEYNKPYIVVTFLSLLDMIKEGTIEVKQKENFSDIILEMSDNKC